MAGVLALPLTGFASPPATAPPRPTLAVSVGPAASQTITRVGGTDLAAPPPPSRIRIPGLGIDAPVDAVGLDPHDALEVPDDPQRVGWWSAGVVPGEKGPAVIVGHVAVREGPGAFLELVRLRRGSEIQVVRGDGSVARFEVTDVTQVAKQEFPVAAVYAPTEAAELRLITCGGAFDPKTRVFLDNVIVSARLIGVTGVAGEGTPAAAGR